MSSAQRYARCVEASKRIRWDIERDVIRGRKPDFSKKFLPDGISQLDRLEFLNDDERRFLSQIQGRTYVNMFSLAERFISAKVLEVSRDHWLGDQTALEALVRVVDEALKHQELFRRMERMIAEGMPAGYSFPRQPNDVAALVLGKCTWAVLALICCIEHFALAHYHCSLRPDENASELWKDVLLYHAREEWQHATLDELEWVRENAKLTAEARNRAVDDLIELVVSVDAVLQLQARADADYFLANARRPFAGDEIERIRTVMLYAYRWQYIVAGVEHPRFRLILGNMITPAQAKRIGDALTPIVQPVAH